MTFEVLETIYFANWLAGLRDRNGRAKVARRIDRMKRGNFGDHKSVGAGVFEMRVGGAGPGYRIYFARRGAVCIVLLCGGDKDSQARDIAQAQRLVEEV